jgi:hypothetical protein
MIIYSNRSVDFSYLNPFNYYKSAEHANRDRDNSILFIDIENHSINGLTLYSTLLLDDIDFGKFGTSYYGNQAMFEVGGRIIPAYSSLPLEINLNYIRIDPYTYTHRIYNNNFSTGGYSLNDGLQPNSENYYIGITSQFHHRISVSLNYSYSRHGANEISNDNVVTNYGGDVMVGHRVDDPLNAKFLDGELEYIREIGFNLITEPVNNYFLILRVDYTNNLLATKKSEKNLIASLAFNIRI